MYIHAYHIHTPALHQLHQRAAAAVLQLVRLQARGVATILYCTIM